MAQSCRRGWRGARITAGWALLAAAGAALGGCFERHEPSNPFIGPSGGSSEAPFGANPAAVDRDAALARAERR